MADEAVLVEGPYETHDFTVASGAAIAKYTLCKLADPRTASATAGTADVFAGIAANDKSATDYSVELGLHTKGIFKLTSAVGGVITAGMPVTSSGANLIRPAIAAELLTGCVIGKALESFASNTTGEVAVGAYV